MAKTKRKLRAIESLENFSEDDSLGVEPGPGEESRRLATFWKDQIKDVDDLNKHWFEKGNAIIKRYRDDRARGDASRRRRLNILWANVKTLLPALYGKEPIPYIERRFIQRDPVGRLSATMLERVVKNEMETNGLHNAIRRAVTDYLLPGRGLVWVRYEPEFGEGPSLPTTPENSLEDNLAGIEGEDISEKSEKLQETGNQLLLEQAPVDFIDWRDGYLFPAKARVWPEVQAVGKKVYISRQEAIARFGKKIGEAIKADDEPADKSRIILEDRTTKDNQKNLIVVEIWNKVDKKVYWVSTGYRYLCDIKKDPLELRDFFPIPEPLSSTLTGDNLVPVPDFIEYQDQALQIDEISQRLALLTQACKVVGTYNSANGSLKRLLNEGIENELLPVDDWATHAESGGVEGGISFLPIEQIQKVIETLTKVRQQLIMDLDLITGISDIIRGTTDSRETLGGIRLKNNNAGTRLSDRQREVALFAKNVIALVAEIIAKHFSEKTIIQASGVLYDDELQPEEIMEELAPSMGQEQQEQQEQKPQQIPQQQQSMPSGIGGSQAPQIPQISQLQGAMNNPQLSQGVLPQNNVIPFPTPPTGGNNLPFMPPNQQQLQQNPFSFNNTPFNPQQIITQRLERAINLLRKDIPRGYRIDIETDSTIFGDAAQERQDATMFITESTKFLMAGTQLGSEQPDLVPLLGRMLLWGVRKFRVGRDLESSFESYIKKTDKLVKQRAKNPQPSPEEIEAQSDQQMSQMKITQIQEQSKAAQQKTQADMAAQQQKMQNDQMRDQQEMEHKTKLAQMEMQLKQQLAQIEIQMKQMELQLKQQEHGMKMEQSQQEHNLNMHQQQQESALSTQEHSQDMQQSKEEHTQSMEATRQQGDMKTQQMKQQGDIKNKQMKQQGDVKVQTAKKMAKTKPKPKANK